MGANETRPDQVNNQSSGPDAVPPHVPTALVREFELETLEDLDPLNDATVLARGAPEIFYAPRGPRGEPSWVLARHELIREGLHDAATFSSKNNAGFSRLFG